MITVLGGAAGKDVVTVKGRSCAIAAAEYANGEGLLQESRYGSVDSWYA
ncbi:MAG: hypothetical protein NNA23_07255 [Nitrospira sp.]|nr:hypothetical protein [Nitrospira sp.]